MASDLPKPSWRRTAPFRLGDLEVHPASGEVRARRGVERLRPLLMDVLLRLAASPGEVVRRETLLEEVWPRRMVNDEVLSRAIAELRTALGDDARQARYIETLPKIGYRLAAPVGPLEPGAAEAAAAPARSTALAAWTGAGAMALVLALAALGLRVEPQPGSDLERRLALAQPFTADPRLEVAPRFSPDGTHVAFALGEGSESRIVVQSIDGVQRRVVGDPGTLNTSPVFFPDGRRLAYWRARAGDCAIVEHDLESGATRALVDCRLRPRARFDLSPDGKRIVFSGVTRAQFPAGLVIADVATGQTRALTTPEPGVGDDLFPRFSPDAKRVAYFHGSESHRQLWVAEVDDPSKAAAASGLEGLSYGAAWLGVNGPLLVAADWFGFRALNLIDLKSGQARLVGARGARFPDVSARGAIVYENAVYVANLWLLDLDSAAPPRALWPSTRYTSQPQFSPDGKRVAFVSNREGDESIYVAALDGEPAKLAQPAGHRHIRPRWSADGRHLYAVRIPIGPLHASQAVRIDVARGTHEVLEALGAAVNEVRESPDGQWLYFGETSGHAMRPMRAPTGRPGNAERLPVPLVSEFQLNGERLVFAQPQLEGLTACRLDGLGCERIEVAISDANRFEWMLGERSIVYRDGPGADARLARYDFALRRHAPSRELPPGGPVGSVAINPSETLVLVSREERTTIDLMLVRR